jgi:hypothetical protein
MRIGCVGVMLWLSVVLLPGVAGGQPPIPGESSIRAKLKACLLLGDLNCVAVQWVALKGTEKLPEWLTLFQRSFDAGKRQAGQCIGVAKAIHEGLTRLGQRPEFYRVTLVGEHRKILGFDEVVNGVFVKSHQVATNQRTPCRRQAAGEDH